MTTQALIDDYLATQSLNLPQDEVALALAALNAVWRHAEADIPVDKIWKLPQRAFNPHTPLHEQPEAASVLADYLPASEHATLRKMYALVDSAHDRLPESDLAVYALTSDENARALLRLVQFGRIQEGLIPVEESVSFQHLAARTAQTAWVNIADSVPQWLQWGDLEGARHSVLSQAAFPVTSSQGAVVGVVYAEAEQAFSVEAQVWLSALALALSEPLLALYPEHAPEADA